MRWRLLCWVCGLIGLHAYEYGEDVTLCWVTNPASAASRSTVCDLNPIIASDFYCGQVAEQACETRAKIRNDGSWSACILRESGCSIATARWDCSPPTLREPCDGASVTIVNISLSQTLELTSGSSRPASVSTFVPAYRQPLNELPHVNFHSCERRVGFCTPFIANTPGLSTHSVAQTAVLSDQHVTLNLTLSLSAGDYTVIAHSRWFDTSGLQHDMARATFARVVDPPPQYAYIDCPSGHVITYDTTVGTTCQPCPEGTYEEAGVLCQPSDSFHYVPLAGQNASGRLSCPQRTQVSRIVGLTRSDGQDGVQVYFEQGGSEA